MMLKTLRIVVCLWFTVLAVPAIGQETLKEPKDGPIPEAPLSEATAKSGGQTNSGGGGGTQQIVPIPPEKFKISPGGVDMRSGQYVYSNTDLSIGNDGYAGLSLTRIGGSGLTISGTHHDRFGSFTHNWDIFISEQRVDAMRTGTYTTYDYQETVYGGGLGTTFRSDYNPVNFSQVSNDGYATLTWMGTPSSGAGAYKMTASDGTIVIFATPNTYGCASAGAIGTRCGFATLVVKPDGTTYTLEYDNNTGGVSAQDMWRLRSVVSSRGYALLLEYNAVSGSYNLIAKACVINLATIIKPSTNACPSGVPTTTYAYAGTFMTSYRDTVGELHAFSRTGTSPNFSDSFYLPGSATPYLTNNVSFTGNYGGNIYAVNSQIFANGQTYYYNWNSYTRLGVNFYYELIGGQYTDNAGHIVYATYGWHEDGGPVWGIPVGGLMTSRATAGPETMIDELGHSWLANYCIPASSPNCYPGWLYDTTDPEGGKILYTYDYNHNATEIRHRVKPGSGLADMVEVRTFDCTMYPVICSKPLTITDPRGNTVTYTYSSDHGGVLSEMGPLVGGVSPLKRYAYTQRYAYLSNGAGGYVAAATPIWLLSEERVCRSGATSNTGCSAGISDEVVTIYDYGPNSGPNNLLLRGKVVSADGVSLRSCYGYDAVGNKTSETSPRAGLASCP